MVKQLRKYSNEVNMYLPNDMFSATVCRTCGLCSVKNTEAAPNPLHCLVLYNADKDNFIKMLIYLAETKKKDIVKFMGYLTFEGFCGLICNNWCPFESSKCLSLTQAIDCYGSFVEQSHTIITDEIKSLLLKRFSNTGVENVGAKFKPTTHKLAKKEKKSIVKMVSRAISAFSKTKKQKSASKFRRYKPAKEIKIKKEVHTTFFFRGNDPEWAGIIRKRLGEEEIPIEQT
jgi:hypothetical protein